MACSPAFGVWAHICGSDLVRDADGTMYVLEDNLRVPSGVSYLLENRLISKRAFADLFERQSVLPGRRVHGGAVEAAGVDRPGCGAACGRASSCSRPASTTRAYFEHSFLAQRMGVELVEGRDLFVADDDCVYMRTIAGPQRVDVIYRRIDDLFLDPEEFRPDSTLGVAGLMRAWRAGNVAIANAPGAGVADDKVVYAWVPDLIRYYLGEEPLHARTCPTFRCLYPEERRHVIDNIGDLVVKPANESGGYGILIGNRATRGRAGRTHRRHRGRPAQLGGATDPHAVDRADAVRRRARAPSRRPPAVHPHRRDELRHQGRA